MRKTQILLLLLFLVISPLAVAQTRNSGNAAANRSWPKFWAEFRAAINRRNKVALKRMMVSPFAVNCTLEGPPDSAEQWLNKVDGAYWRKLQKMMRGGTKSRTGGGGKPQRVTTYDPEDTQLFEFGTDGRWRWLGCACWEC